MILGPFGYCNTHGDAPKYRQHHATPEADFVRLRRRQEEVKKRENAGRMAAKTALP